MRAAGVRRARRVSEGGEWVEKVRAERKRREELARKIEAVLIESGCTYGDARMVLGWLSSHYELASEKLADTVRVSELAKEPFKA